MGDLISVKKYTYFTEAVISTFLCRGRMAVGGVQGIKWTACAAGKSLIAHL
jgi:hypothetical protein